MASLTLTFLRPLFGTKPALILAVLLQVYFPGWLLARALGKNRCGHPVSRFAWVLLCGLSLTICLGGLARALEILIPIYLLILHGLMLALAVFPKIPQAGQVGRWTFSAQNWPLHALLVLCCLVALYVGYERNRFRINGYEDQTVFISLADWLANNPDDPGLLDRRVGVLNPDRRWTTDGWTYNHAAWVWTSGVSAADLIWSDVTGLFIWAVPLAVFALAYEVTRRETAAAWSTAALTLAGLLTLDSLVYVPTSLAFGQFALFQVNTLRSFSNALVLPLALMAALAYLHTPGKRDWVLVVLAGAALALLHPRQIVILQAGIGATVIVWWLAEPTRKRLKRGLWLALALALLLPIPYLQRENRPSISRVNEQTEQIMFTSERVNRALVAPGRFLPLDLPIVGETYIVRPGILFYHPIIVLVVAAGLAAGVVCRRSLAAQYTFAATAMTLILLLTPGLTPLIARLISASLVVGLVFMLPLPLSLGLALDWIFQRLNRFNRRHTQPIFAGVLAGGMLLLLFEPVPIPASPRDQIRASNRMQATRDMQPWDRALVAALNDVLPHSHRSIIMSPSGVANYIIENVPHTLILGGRASSNVAHPANARFFTEVTSRSPTANPWLDRKDIEAIHEWGVTHIIIEADDSRLPQLVMQPERFKRLTTTAGFLIFEVQPNITVTPVDDLFGQMNAVYAELEQPRWEPGSINFQLPRPSDAASWREIVWDSHDGNLAVYGRALTLTLSGEDTQALPLWEELSAAYPDMFLFRSAAAHTRRMVESSPEAIRPLLDSLDSDFAPLRVLAARDLLNAFFLYLLDDAHLDRIIAAAEAESVIWRQLADHDQPAQVRERTALLMSRGRYNTAGAWLKNGLTALEVSPQDIILWASIKLAQGDVDGALAALRPATDADYYAANRYYHPDRWENNVAARMYNTLIAEESYLLRIAGQGALYVAQPEIAQSGDQLTVTALFGNPHGQPYPVRTWRVLVLSPDGLTKYAEIEVPAAFDEIGFARASLEVDLPPNLPELTPARIIIEPRYDDAITFPPAAVDRVLNRPETAPIPIQATRTDLRFGESVRLLAYAAEHDTDELAVTLYWQTDSPLTDNYQVFVHVVDANGITAAQRDVTPVDNRYPTSQWRLNTIIKDRHVIPIESLPPGNYTVRIGLYRLPEVLRLPVQPADERVQNDSVQVYSFALP